MRNGATLSHAPKPTPKPPTQTIVPTGVPADSKAGL
jgi:hypothetical protein